MKTRKVSIDVLKEPTAPKTPSPREIRRMELESKLEDAITTVRNDATSAIKVVLDQGEKLSGIRLAFNRVKDRVRATEVNLHKRGDDLYIAALPITRGRRRKGS
jgi:hypothetical protein